MHSTLFQTNHADAINKHQNGTKCQQTTDSL